MLNGLRVREIKVQLAEKNKIKIHVLYGPSHTNRDGRSPGVEVEGGGARGGAATSGKAVIGSSAGG